MSRKSPQLTMKSQHGGALAIAIFIIIVMSLLVTAIGRNISASVDQSVHEVLSARALFAAQYANEVALAALFPIASGSLPTSGNCASVTTATSSFATGFNNQGSVIDGLANCVAVRVECAETTISGQKHFRLSFRGVCKSDTSSSNLATCLNNDAVCVSRTVEVEAKAL